MNQLFNLTAFYKNKSLRQFYLGLIAILFSFQATVVFGQDGVSGNLSINNPTGNLTDYSNGSLNKLTLNLTATDAELGSRTVRFKLYIENGNSVFAIGSDVVAGATAAITLPFGSLQTFNSTQLAPYFRLENLQGINAGVYNSAMPEGLYRFTFEIITTNTNEVIGRISQQFWLTLNDPPLLNIPTNGENVNAANPTFSWIPRWSTTQTNYLFTLVNLGTNTNNVNLIQQFLAMENTPLHRSQPLTTNSYAYTTGVPALIAGNTYAWRVQAINGNFKNNGYSEIYVFKYLGSCESVTGLTTTARGTDAIDVRWNPSAIHGSYKVQYRKRSTGDANTWRWFELTTTNPFATLTQLEANTEYEIKVGGVCTADMTTYTAPSVCRTAATTSDPTCGQNVSINITNTTPLAVLRINDTIRAAEIPVCVSKVTNGANGIFSGEGWGKLPWLGETKIKVRFSNVAINNEYKLTNGFIETVYDPNWGNMLSIDGLFEGGQTVGIVRTGKDTTDFAVNFAINGPSNIVFAPNGNGGGTITVTGSNGQTQTFNVTSLPTTIKDSQGRVYVVKPPNGAVSLLGQQQPLAMSKAELNGLSPDKGVVTFLPHGFYAFDAHDVAYEQDVLWRVKYERLGDYGVPRKAAAPGKPDVLKARITLADNALNADNVKFMNSKGMSFTSRRLAEAGTYEIDIVGGPGGDAQEIYALYPKANETGKYWSLGKILIAAYTPQKRKLVLVPVNGANVNKPMIQDSLNAIYNPVCIEWEVLEEGNFINDTWDTQNNGLDTEGSGMLTALTSEMKALNNAYKLARNVERSTIYLFVLRKSAESGVAGDMPRGHQFGYLFNSSINNMGSTAAHEVGHGVFNLKHPFDGYNFTASNLADNLMGYDGGRNLSKYQWDQIHDKGYAISIFDNDQDSKLVAGYWYNPAGYPVLLANGVAGMIPVDDIVSQSKINDILYGWKTNGVEFKAKIINNMFYGYYKLAADGTFTSEIYNDNQSYRAGDNLIVLAARYKFDCTLKYVKTVYTVPNSIPNHAAYQGGLPIVTAQQLASSYTLSNNPTPSEYDNRPVEGCGRKSMLSVVNLTGLSDISQLEQRIKNLFKSDEVNPLTGKGIVFNGSMVITTFNSSPQQMAQAGTYTPQDNEVLFWVHLNQDDKLIIKKILFGNGVSQKLQNGLNFFTDNYNFSQLSFLEQTSNVSLAAFDACFGAIYQTLDYISSLLEGAKIPEKVYNCRAEGYNKFYAKILGLASGNVAATVWNQFQSVFSFTGSNMNDLTAETLSEMQFAFLCGLWNGLVGTVQSLPDLAKMLVAPLSSTGRADIIKKANSFLDMEIKDSNGNIICQKADILCKIKEILSNLTQQFNLSNPQTQCLAAHNYGEIVGPIIVISLGDVAATGTLFNTVLGSIGKVFKWCDKVTDLFSYANKLTPSFVKRGANQLMMVVKRGTANFIEQIGDNLVRITARCRYINSNDFAERTFELRLDKLDEFLEQYYRGQDKFTYDGKEIEVPSEYRVSRDVLGNPIKKMLTHISYNVQKVKDYFKRPNTSAVSYIVEDANGTMKIYKSATGRTPDDHIATIFEDKRIEIYKYESNSIDQVGISTIDVDGKPVGFKADGTNCGVYVNGRWACFTAETLVHTEGGTTPIKNIVAGQKVWSYDMTTGKKVLSSVVKTMTGATKRLYQVFVGKDTLKATEEHPFYANEQWTAAKDLRKGASILLLSGMLGVVDSVATIDTLATTYNFEVEKTHNYFVGTEGVLVHNSCTAMNTQLLSLGLNTLKNQFVKLPPVLQEKFWKQFLDAPSDILRGLNNDNPSSPTSMFNKWVSGDPKYSAPSGLERYYYDTDTDLSRVNHADIGDFSRPNNLKREGLIPSKMLSGGHGQTNIDYLRAMNWNFHIEHTYPNGVRVGNVPKNSSSDKNGIGTRLGSPPPTPITWTEPHVGAYLQYYGHGQAWFPSSWTKADIETAKNHIIASHSAAISALPNSGELRILYRGVNIIVKKTDGMGYIGNIGSIYPDKIQ